MTCVLSLIWTGIAWGFMTGPGIIITVPNLAFNNEAFLTAMPAARGCRPNY